jgi:hypothetical protein
MLNNFKNAVKKKKLHFNLKATNKNIAYLQNLLKNNIISSFQASALDKKNLIAFINYGRYFESSVTAMGKTAKKISTQKSSIFGIDNIGVNFVVNLKQGKNLSSNFNTKFR